MTQETDDLTKHPGINEDLVRQYHEAGDLKNLIALFNFMRRTMLRAESLATAYQRQMFVLHNLLEDAKRGAINEPRARRIIPAEPTISKPKQTENKPEPKTESKPKRPQKGEIVDISI